MPGEVTAIIAALFYSLSYIFLRKGQDESDFPDHGLLLVLTLSSLILGLSLLVYAVHVRLSISDVLGWGQSIQTWVIAGIIGTLFGRLTLYAAIDRLGPTRSLVVKTTENVITIAIGVFVLRERIHQPDMIGSLFLLLGVVFLFFERLQLGNRASAFFRSGMALGLTAALFQGIGHFFSQVGFVGSASPIVGAAVDMGSAFFTYLCLLAVTGRLRPYVSSYIRQWNLNLCASAFFSAAAILSFFSALSNASVSTVSAVLGTQPILIALFSAILLPKVERISWVSIVSSVCVTIGVSVMSFW